MVGNSNRKYSVNPYSSNDQRTMLLRTQVERSDLRKCLLRG